MDVFALADTCSCWSCCCCCCCCWSCISDVGQPPSCRWAAADAGLPFTSFGFIASHADCRLAFAHHVGALLDTRYMHHQIDRNINNSRGVNISFCAVTMMLASTKTPLLLLPCRSATSLRDDIATVAETRTSTQPFAPPRQHVRHRIRQHGPVPGPHRVRPARHRLPPRGRPGTVRTPVRGVRGGPDPQARRARCLRPTQRAGCKSSAGLCGEVSFGLLYCRLWALGWWDQG